MKIKNKITLMLKNLNHEIIPSFNDNNNYNNKKHKFNNVILYYHLIIIIIINNVNLAMKYQHY